MLSAQSTEEFQHVYFGIVGQLFDVGWTLQVDGKKCFLKMGWNVHYVHIISTVVYSLVMQFKCYMS